MKIRKKLLTFIFLTFFSFTLAYSASMYSCDKGGGQRPSSGQNRSDDAETIETSVLTDNSVLCMFNYSIGTIKVVVKNQNKMVVCNKTVDTSVEHYLHIESSKLARGNYTISFSYTNTNEIFSEVNITIK